jgi:predicted ArsR family transcriptional regulator
MLSLIIETLQEDQPVCAETLAYKLKMRPDTVIGMLDELIRMGRVKVEKGEAECELCQLKSLCALPMQSSPLYRLS